MSIRRAFLAGSTLRAAIRVGKQALRPTDRDRVDSEDGQILESLDLEAALPPQAPSIKRWDYLLGTTIEGSEVCGLEVHPANTGEARVVIAKKKDTEQDLKPHQLAGHLVKRWYWVASGTTKITRNMPEARLLDLAGIELVGSHLILGAKRARQKK